MARDPAPHLFTIPASRPFLPTLIGALRDGRLGIEVDSDPLAYANVTLYLPTRRACRLAQDMFLDVIGTSAAILPRIVPIGDPDEDELIFSNAAIPGAAALDIPRALEGVERRFLLAQLVTKWARSSNPSGEDRMPLVAQNPAAALALTDDLARLMDDMVTRKVPWERLDKIVPAELDEYWHRTLDFLQIARHMWPLTLAQYGAIEPAERRDALIEAEAQRLAMKTDALVIAAGSTGSMPATAEFLSAIAKLPHGAVVLPGLDTDLEDRAWDLIGGGKTETDSTPPAIGHPQFALHALLRRMGVTRGDVVTLAKPSSWGREKLVSEALRPAAATEQWRARTSGDDFAAHAQTAIDTLTVIEAATPEEEALAIAIALREAAEQQHSAALITPDRALARRVLAALGRWNVTVDDSGGDPLASTPAGVFARLATDVALTGVAPIPLLALLKHPLLRLGEHEGHHARAIATLERAILRGPRPRAGTQGLAHALTTFRIELTKFRNREGSDLHGSDPRIALGDQSLDAAAALIAALTKALEPLESVGRGEYGFSELAARHRTVIEALSSDDQTAVAAFARHDGAALDRAFDALAESEPAAGFRLKASDYAEVFAAAISDRVVRRPALSSANVRILGPLEARLTSATRVILGGLNEGTWPPEVRSDGWLSRPMRQALGLDLPERRISLSAHDFAQMLGAEQVILTRATKASGAPTVSSRFVQRLAAVAGPRWGDAQRRGDVYLTWARHIDTPAQPPQAFKRPRPKPPVAARPTRMSVTEIETWLRDPYSIYAKHILRLRPLDAVDTPPGAADRGSVIHGAIGEFTQRYAQELPPDPLTELMTLGRKHFAALEDYPEAKAFWWPRYERIARWFAAWEIRRRPTLTRVLAEIRGELQIPLTARTFKLSARADRIECIEPGKYAILDYKTGAPPTASQVACGLAPQLTLEGALLRAGTFADVAVSASVEAYTYVAIRGGEPPGLECPIQWKDQRPDDAADGAMNELLSLVTRFEDIKTGYLSRESPMFIRRGGGDYDHLARVREWTLFGGAEEEDR